MQIITADELLRAERPVVAVNCSNHAFDSICECLKNGPGSIIRVFDTTHTSAEAWINASLALQHADAVVIWIDDGRYTQPTESVFIGMAINVARRCPIWAYIPSGAPCLAPPITAFWPAMSHIHTDRTCFLNELHHEFVSEYTYPEYFEEKLNQVYEETLLRR